MNIKTYIKLYPVTCAIILLITVVYLLMTLAGGSEKESVLIAFGANYYPMVINGEFWRLITCNFLHIGLVHLVLNAVALLSLGGLAETLFRKTKYILLYVLSGFAGALASCFISRHAISAGASGAVFGIVGAIIVYSWDDPRFRSNKMMSSLVILVVINLAIGFTMPFIDNAAHIGGLVSGLAIGGVFRLMRR